MSTAAVTKREAARAKNFEKTVAAQPGPAKPYDAKRDPAVNAKGNLSASVPSTRESRLAVLDAEKAEDKPLLYGGSRVDPNCGMPDKHEFVLDVFQRWLNTELTHMFEPDLRRYTYPLIEQYPRVFWVASIVYVTTIKPAIIEQAPNCPYAYRQVDPAVLPQELQSAEEVHSKLAASSDREDELDKAAEERWKVKPARINELFEAIQVAIAHPLKVEAQELTDGFVIVKNPHVWKLTHVALDRQPVIATRLDEKDDYRDVTRRSDIRECLVALREAVEISRVKRGIKPPKPPKKNGNGHVSAAVKTVVEQAASARKFNKSVTNTLPPKVAEGVPAWNLVKLGDEVVQGL